MATTFVATTSVALATDLHVTTAVDGAPGSLRSQIAAFNPGDTIIIDSGIDPQVDPALPVGDPGSGISTLGKNLVIQGQGVSETTISPAPVATCGPAAQRTRLLNVTGGFVAIAQVTFTGGCGRYAVVGGPVTPDDGGAIFNAGSLNLDQVALTNNQAGDAIDVAASTSGGYGGAIFNAASGTLVIDHSTISGNRAGFGHLGTPGMDSATPTNGGMGQNGGWGGGIATDGAVTIANSTISGNLAGRGGNGGEGGDNTTVAAPANGGAGGTGGFGGGISRGHGMTTPGPAVTITNSTVSGNQAGAGGTGGIGGHNSGPPFLFGENGAGGQGGNGGGIGRDIQAALVHDTVAGNSAGAGGPPTGGIGGLAGGWDYAISGGSAQNTIVASNTAPSFPQFANCDGAVQPTNAGHNIAFPAATGCPGTWGTGDPKLGPLAANGGPTQTRALGAGSAALDQVPDTGAGCTAADQRGVSRPQPAGGLCDIGAFEARQFALNVATAGSGSGTVTGAAIACPPDCTETYLEGTVVSLAANPAAGSTFGGWSGDCTGASCSLTMGAARFVTATFDARPQTGTPPGGSPTTGETDDRKAARKRCKKKAKKQGWSKKRLKKCLRKARRR